MAHRIDAVWFADPVPSPSASSHNEKRDYFARKTGPARTTLQGVGVDDLELSRDEVIITVEGHRRSVPLSNVVAYEPPRPQRNRNKQADSEPESDGAK